jgi:hypothetical protein
MEPKPWWQSRTLIVNLVIIALTVGLAVLAEFGIRPLPQPGPEIQAWVVVIVSVINLILRWWTSEPIQNSAAARARVQKQAQ